MIEFVGFVHVVPPAHAEATPVIVDAAVSSECVFPAVANVVEVTVTFQPDPVPVKSFTVSGSVYVGVWSVPSRVADTLGVALVEIESEPPVTVAVAVTFAASAVAVSARLAAVTATAVTSLRSICFLPTGR